MPLQQSLLTYLSQCRVNIPNVVTQMSDHRLLKAEYTPRVLDTLELGGAEAAAVRLLASLYSTHVDMLKDDYTDWVAEGRSSAGGVVEPPGGDSPFWLNALMQSIEAHGGQGFSQTVPKSLLSADTWATVYGKSFFRPLVLACDIIPQ